MSEEFQNPYDTPEYQAFVESIVPHCRCEYDKPCEGVLAGGICERKKEREDFYEWRDNEAMDEA